MSAVAPIAPKVWGVPLKWVSLVSLVLQTTSMVLMIRYSSLGGGQQYVATAAVMYMEAVKYLSCLVVVLAQSGGVAGVLKVLREEVYGDWREVAKLSVPSFLYTLQNNLLYLAINNLDGPTYQVIYNSKIITTGLFSVLLLGRTLGAQKWSSLVLLTLGVSLTQLSPDAAEAAEGSSRMLGFFCVMAAACTSGFAGVYFEKMLKGSKATLWVRNLQMATTTVPLAMLMMYLKDGARVAEVGVHHGFSPLVVTIILNQALGGLLVAVVVKYADNILKAFAAAISIITSTVISALFFGFHITPYFLVGATVVLFASYLYSAEKAPALLPSFLRNTKDVTV